MSIASTAARWVRIIGWVWLIGCLSIASIPVFSQSVTQDLPVSQKLAADPVWQMLNDPALKPSVEHLPDAPRPHLTAGQATGMWFMAGIGIFGFVLSRLLAFFLSRLGIRRA